MAHGFIDVFWISYEGQWVHVMLRNLHSTKGMEGVVRQKLQKELEGSRISGPHTSLPIPNLHVSPLRIVPPKVPVEFRLIHHLSYPKGWGGGAVNHAIDPTIDCGSHGT